MKKAIYNTLIIAGVAGMISGFSMLSYNLTKSKYPTEITQSYHQLTGEISELDYMLTEPGLVSRTDLRNFNLSTFNAETENMISKKDSLEQELDYLTSTPKFVKAKKSNEERNSYALTGLIIALLSAVPTGLGIFSKLISKFESKKL